MPASRQATNVAIITIKGEINAVTARSVERRIALAEKDGADALVFELDTPGGDVFASVDISRAIKGSAISNTVAWVNPNALSGGAIVALACREIVVSDNAVLGDALAIKLNILGMINEMGQDERQKFLVLLLSDLVDSARRNGYDEKLVQGVASRGVELWLVEHVQTGERLFIDRAEYRVIFGKEPPEAQTPAIPSASGGTRVPVMGEAPSPIETESIVEGTSDAGDEAEDGADGGMRLHDGPLDPEKELQPATPAITPSMAAEIGQAQDQSSSRPRLSAADLGQWRELEYVADGQGLITLQTREMKRYGLATQTINTDEELKQFFGATNLERLDRSWSEALVVAMTSFAVRGILIVIFLLGLFIEMTHPGLMVPGMVAMLALALLIVPPFLNDMAAWWEILAIGLGLLLIVLEIFVIPGTAVTGVVGMILLFAGLVGTFVGGSGGLFPDSPRQQSDMLWGAVTVLLSLTVSGVLMYFFARHFGSIPIVGRLVLQDVDPESAAGGGLLAAMAMPVTGPVAVGDEGVTVTPLRPSGRVQVGDEIIDASADFEYVDAGSPVRIVRVEGLRIVVEPIADAGGEAASPPEPGPTTTEA